MFIVYWKAQIKHGEAVYNVQVLSMNPENTERDFVWDKGATQIIKEKWNF